MRLFNSFLSPEMTRVSPSSITVSGPGFKIFSCDFLTMAKLKRELKTLKAEHAAAKASPASSHKKADKDVQKKTNVTPLKEQPASFDRKEK